MQQIREQSINGLQVINDYTNSIYFRRLENKRVKRCQWSLSVLRRMKNLRLSTKKEMEVGKR